MARIKTCKQCKKEFKGGFLGSDICETCRKRYCSKCGKEIKPTHCFDTLENGKLVCEDCLDNTEHCRKGQCKLCGKELDDDEVPTPTKNGEVYCEHCVRHRALEIDWGNVDVDTSNVELTDEDREMIGTAETLAKILSTVQMKTCKYCKTSYDPKKYFRCPHCNAP